MGLIRNNFKKNISNKTLLKRAKKGKETINQAEALGINSEKAKELGRIKATKKKRSKNPFKLFQKKKITKSTYIPNTEILNNIDDAKLLKKSRKHGRKYIKEEKRFKKALENSGINTDKASRVAKSAASEKMSKNKGAKDKFNKEMMSTSGVDVNANQKYSFLFVFFV